MNTLAAILLMMCASRGVAVPEMRALFLQSYKTEGAARRLNSLLKETESKDPIAIGYMGISEIMLCNYVSNPFSKLSHFNRGKKLLESAISNASTNAELRYLRFTIQTNVPAILRYKDNIAEDKHLLLTYILHHHPYDPQLDRMITEYLSQSSAVTEVEKGKLKLIKNE